MMKKPANKPMKKPDMSIMPVRPGKPGAKKPAPKKPMKKTQRYM